MTVQARARIIIHGQVQGVFFRKNIMDLAKTLGVRGWVRNLHDRTVEAVAEGERSRLEELVRFCQTGPPGAKVNHVDVEWADSQGEFRGFRITH